MGGVPTLQNLVPAFSYGVKLFSSLHCPSSDPTSLFSPTSPSVPWVHLPVIPLSEIPIGTPTPPLSFSPFPDDSTNLPPPPLNGLGPSFLHHRSPPRPAAAPPPPPPPPPPPHPPPPPPPPPSSLSQVLPPKIASR